MATTLRDQNQFSLKICRSKDFPVLLVVIITVLLFTISVHHHAMLRTN